MSRYNSRTKGLNDAEMYKEVKDDRGVQEIVQFITPVFSFPLEEDLKRIQTVDYTWNQGDQFWRLASKHYGDPKMWWVIAQFNRKPTEGHLSPGDVIKIPIELSVVLGVFE
jgi:nucleoid-associated protein YgaU